MDYTDMADRDGEIQIFRQYRREVSIAKQPRAEVLAASPPSNAETLERRIWAHAETVRRRRLPAKENEPSGYPEMESLLKNRNLTLHSFACRKSERVPVDPVFGLPLWLQEGDTWAYNRTHLALIKAGGLMAR